MAIEGICQPEILQVDENIRLRKFDGIYDFAYDWYQDEETVYLVDGVRKSYSQETLKCMYEYLDKQGELYFIEVLEGNAYLPIGDVTFWKDDMPIVIGNKSYRGKGIAKKVIGALIERGKTLGYDTLHVNEIYDFNIASRKCFESMGFVACEKTEKGNRFVLENNMDLRLAKFEDLPQLREMYKAIVNHMRQQGLEIWDEIYPCEFLAEDVQEKRLYILIEKELIVGAFALCESNAGEKAVEWKWNTDKVLYLDRLGVNVNCLKRGIASRMLNEATSLAKEKNVSSLRLFVVDTNEPAINLYLKNGFEKATGVFEEVIDEDLVLVEYGFEKVVVANQNQYKVEFGNEADISSWMELVGEISWNFPGLETDEKIEEHRNTV